MRGGHSIYLMDVAHILPRLDQVLSELVSL